ncbi:MULTISPECIES: DUF6348 family protein [Myxococcus]|uniref:DUF6348 family protein n=1 Tax=Myxococcus TaxID=32 RepID=UPI00114401C3|nr:MULTISPECIES: DUF6348 family protein [Myxococcus]NOK05438.1 hypothetical protein [Myxococcus xanthus]
MDAIPASEPLRDLIEAHGVECHEEGEWLRLGQTGPRARAWYVQPAGTNPEQFVQLDVEVELWAGRMLGESFVGIGASPTDARQSAYQSFAAGSLHVLLGALLNAPCEHITVEEWNVGGIPRRVFLGQIVTRSLSESDAPPPEWTDSLKGALESLPLTTGTHWLRIYFAQSDEEVMKLEVLLDNEEWPELQAALANAPWPKAQGFLSHRLFLVLQGGVDVSRAVAAFIESPDRDIDEIRHELRAQGASALESDKLVSFIPEAFGAVIAINLGAKPPVAAQYREWNAPGLHEASLAQEPLWQESVRLAKLAASGETLTRGQLMAVAGRSAVLDAFNKFLHAGSVPKDVEFASMVVGLSKEGMQAMNQEVAARTAATPSIQALEQGTTEFPKRPWWKFW